MKILTGFATFMLIWTSRFVLTHFSIVGHVFIFFFLLRIFLQFHIDSLVWETLNYVQKILSLNKSKEGAKNCTMENLWWSMVHAICWSKVSLVDINRVHINYWMPKSWTKRHSNLTTIFILHNLICMIACSTIFELSAKEAIFRFFRFFFL